MKPRVLLSLLAVLTCGIAAAADYTTERFAVDYAIDKDRLVTVTETIDVTFTAPSRGLIRTIPFRVRGNSGKLRQADFDLVSVEVDYGRGFQSELSKAAESGGDWKLRIGNAEVTHTGKATYRIQYTVRGALTDQNKNDALGPRTELYWNVIPAHWATAIDRAEGVIRFPEPAQGDTAARFLIGEARSRRGVEVHLDGKVVGGNPNLKAEFSGTRSVKFWTTRSMRSGEGITAVVALPKGTVKEGPATAEVPVTDELGRPYGGTQEALPGADLFSRPIPNNPLGYLLPLAVLPVVYLLAKPKMLPKSGPLTVRFEPPDGAGASEAGLLIDGNVDSRDIIAGIVALAQKGALRLRHEGGEVAGVTIEVLPFNHSRDTTPFEQRLYASLEPFGPVISPESLKGTFYPSYEALKQELYHDSIQKSWFRSHGSAGCPVGCLLAFVLICGGGMLVPMLGIPVVIGAVIALIGSLIILSKTTNLLPQGRKLRDQCLGLKEFITRANQRELNYMAQRMPDQAMFEELLPFAVAFDAVRQWTKAFEGIDLQPPDWYYGYDTYGTDYLWTSMLLNDMMYFDHTYSDAVSTPPVTSFDSGGGWGDGDSGFGGGFSGGSDSGGGSWDSGGSVDSGGGGGGGDSW
jgi:hypothetical protein